MTAAEALASPHIGLVYQIAGFLVDNEPNIGPFLAGG